MKRARESDSSEAPDVKWETKPGGSAEECEATTSAPVASVNNAPQPCPQPQRDVALRRPVTTLTQCGQGLKGLNCEVFFDGPTVQRVAALAGLVGSENGHADIDCPTTDMLAYSRHVQTDGVDANILQDRESKAANIMRILRVRFCHPPTLRRNSTCISEMVAGCAACVQLQHQCQCACRRLTSSETSLQPPIVAADYATWFIRRTKNYSAATVRIAGRI